MHFFANFRRVNTISIIKIAVKSRKLCVKTSFWYIPEIIAHIFNQQDGERGVSKISLRNRVRGHIANVTDHYKGGGKAKFSPKTALCNVWMIPFFVFPYLSLNIMKNKCDGMDLVVNLFQD